MVAPVGRGTGPDPRVVQLSVTVTAQDIEPDPDGGLRIGQRVVPDRVI